MNYLAKIRKKFQRNKNMAIAMKEKQDTAFSSIDFVGQCLVDEERTIAFQKAINEVIKNDDVVLDLGTGSGIMALCAAKAGAKKVYAVEFDPYVASIAKNNIELNGLDNKVSLLIDDARKVDLLKGEKATVVIAEILTTAMVDEPQIQAINNLYDKGLVDASTRFIPCRQDSNISLVNADFSMFGLKMPMVLHLWRWHKWSRLGIKKITDQLVLNSIAFNKKNTEYFEGEFEFEVKKSGIINGVYLTSRTFLTEDIFLDDTEALNAPMLVPINEKQVKEGQKIRLKVTYVFGGSYREFNVNFLA